MTEIERYCNPPIAKEISPAARVMINLCLGLGWDHVPEGNYDGTNLQGLSGRSVESLSVSDLEKVTLLAAGFTRTPQFDRKKFGKFDWNGDGWSLCQTSSEQPFDDAITSALGYGENTIGIRVNPAKRTAGDTTQPSRPYQKIRSHFDRGLIKNNGHIVGIYRHQDNNSGYNDPYFFAQGDTVELFIEPKPKTINGIKKGGGFAIKIAPDGVYDAYITTDGVNVRNVHDSIAAGNTVHISGRLDDEVQDNLILLKFFRQDGSAVKNLREAVDRLYPQCELILQANYAFTEKEGLLIYVFDAEIPPKIDAQWRSQNSKPVVPYFDAYCPEIAVPYLSQITRRFIDRQALND